MTRVFLNPGHCPSVDPGAISNYYDVSEADIVAEIGELIRYYLEDKDIEVMVEQTDNLCGEEQQDWFDSVCYHANDWGADFFVSLHCNAFNRIANGTEVFHGGPIARGLAGCVQDNLVNAIGTVDRGIKDGSHLMVIKYTDMPAILIEIAFIDNRYDCETLISNKDTIAKAIANSIIEYIDIMESD